MQISDTRTPDTHRTAAINRTYLQTAIQLHQAGQASWLLSRFDLSAEMLEDLTQLSPAALDTLHADMETTLFSLEVSGESVDGLLACTETMPANWMASVPADVFPGVWLIVTVLQELAVSAVHSDSAAYCFNCDQLLAKRLSSIHPMRLAELAMAEGTRLRARFSRNHVMAADVASAFPVGLLMALH